MSEGQENRRGLVLEGPSASQLRKRNTDLFKEPNLDMFFDGGGSHVRLPLAGTDIFVSDDQLDAYGQAAESLLDEIGKHFDRSDKSYPIATQAPVESAGDWKINPNYLKSDWVAGRVTALQVLEDQINGWFLGFSGLRGLQRTRSRAAEHLYNAARNGLYHEVMIRHGLELSHGALDALKVITRPESEGGLLVILNPAKFVTAIQQHFRDWLEEVATDPVRQAHIENELPSRQAPASGSIFPQMNNMTTRAE